MPPTRAAVPMVYAHSRPIRSDSIPMPIMVKMVKNPVRLNTQAPNSREKPASTMAATWCTSTMCTGSAPSTKDSASAQKRKLRSASASVMPPPPRIRSEPALPGASVAPKSGSSPRSCGRRR